MVLLSKEARTMRWAEISLSRPLSGQALIKEERRQAGVPSSITRGVLARTLVGDRAGVS